MGYTSNMDNHPGKNSLFDVATADDIVYRLEISFEYQDGFLAGLKREYDDKDFAEAEGLFTKLVRSNPRNEKALIAFYTIVI